LERVLIQNRNNELFAIIKNEVAGNKSFDDCCTRWVCMVINFVLGSLCIFAQTGTNVTTETYKVKEKIINRIAILTRSSRMLQLSKDFIIKRSTLARNILFCNMWLIRIAAMLLKSDRLAGGAKRRSLKRC
jgi:hypothetical protein